MPKVALIQVVYQTRRFIPIVFPEVFKQTYKDLDFYAVIAGNDGNSKEYIQEHFPQVKIIDPGYNIGFSRGHNELFATVDAEFFQLINPDLVITPTFVEEMLKPFEDPKVGAVSGKILQYDFAKNEPINKIDTTGVIMARSGRGRDRGQHEVDQGQYDNLTDIFAASGAAVMYRSKALESVKYKRDDGRYEYFDEDFFMYWEEIDLGWRLLNEGWKAKYNPHAVAYHGRTAASSPGGYKRVWAFIKHHRQLSPRILQWNYKNHIFMFLKNTQRWYWQFFAREFFYHCYVLVWETKTFKVWPEMFRLLPSIWKKRKYIQQHKKVSANEIERLLQ
jgi:GT2 family glycosyltransferase